MGQLALALESAFPEIPRRRPRMSTEGQTVVRVLMNGVTGRMGHRQHLVRSVLAIREEGGVRLANGSRVQLEPVLIGRDARKLREIATRYGLEHWTTNLSEALAAAPGMAIY